MAIQLRNTDLDMELQILRSEKPEIDQLLALFPEDQIEKIVANKDKLDKVMKSFNGFTSTTSVNTMVIKCSDNCPYKDVCIFKKNNMHPIGSPCPVEKKMILDIHSDIVQSLDVDLNNPVEMEMIWDLIDLKLIDVRASVKLKDGEVVQLVENKIGNKVIASKEEVNPAVMLKIDIKKLKHSIMDAFIATRRAKKKYGMTKDINSIEQLFLDISKDSDDED